MKKGKNQYLILMLALILLSGCSSTNGQSTAGNNSQSGHIDVDSLEGRLPSDESNVNAENFTYDDKPFNYFTSGSTIDGKYYYFNAFTNEKYDFFKWTCSGLLYNSWLCP